MDADGERPARLAARGDGLYERLLPARRPCRGASGSAVVIALALLPGYPQAVFFAYQLIVLRVLWALGGREAAAPIRSVAAIAGGAMGPLLGRGVPPAGPGDGARVVRSLPSRARGGDWAGFRRLIARGDSIPEPVVLAGSAPAPHTWDQRPLGWWARVSSTSRSPSERHAALPDLRPPPARDALFRDPEHFMWIASLALAILCGISGASWRPRRPAAFRSRGSLRPPSRRDGTCCRPSGLRAREWMVAGLAVAAVLLALRPTAAGSRPGSPPSRWRST